MQFASHKVYILELPSGARALADPGTVEVDRGDTIEFENQTWSSATLLIAEGNVLDGVQPLQGAPLPKGVATPFTVASGAADGVHEYQVLVLLRDRRQVYAVGESTPRIIIRPPARD